MGSNQLRWLWIVQCFALTAFLGIGACGGDDDDDSDGAVDEEHGAHDDELCSDEGGHHAEEGDTDGGDEELVGTPTGATCPDDNTLTYETFGKDFMNDFCVRCHSSELTDCEDRNGAPFEHDFDTLGGILTVADHIDQKAASGPKATNDSMPPDGKMPTMEQRKQLGQWLACEQERLANQ